jgi:hypothetical protein
LVEILLVFVVENSMVVPNKVKNHDVDLPIVLWAAVEESLG